MGKNDYAKRLNEARQRRETVIKLWMAQLCFDATSLALNDPEIMGKDVFGRKRLVKLDKGLNKWFSQIYPSLTGAEEASYIRAKVDERLKEIYGDDFVPWPERYENWDDSGI